MDWSPQQQHALDEVARWLGNSREQVFSLMGFAGTGKTTLAKHLAEGVGNVLFAAYTGKAASVMRKRGCNLATTIHQLIYLPANRSRARLLELEEKLWEIECETPIEDRPTDKSILRVKQEIEQEKERLKRPAFTLNPDSPLADANLLIIDEASMVDTRMGNDLLSFEVPILVLGDPAQLPPVQGGGFFTEKKPDIMLTEVHRQAWDSPVLAMATKVRQGQPLEEGNYGSSLVMRGKPPQDLVTGCDQILVGTNETRRKCNVRMRALLGRGVGSERPLPVAQDKVVCLRNDHMEGLLNGTIWTVEETSPGVNDDRIGMAIHDEDGHTTFVEGHTHYFEGREKDLQFWDIRDAQCFDYGYALTTHKAQGSQWPSVFVFDESWVFRGSARNWLYTAITRASERVVICRS